MEMIELEAREIHVKGGIRRQHQTEKYGNHISACDFNGRDTQTMMPCHNLTEPHWVASCVFRVRAAI